MSLDDLFRQIQAGNLKELNIIVKADVQGSVEAVKQSLLKLSNDEVVVKSSMAASAPSTSPMLLWQLRPMRLSSASTCVRTAGSQGVPQSVRR